MHRRYIYSSSRSHKKSHTIGLLGSRIEKCGCPIVITSSVQPSVCLSNRLSVCPTVCLSVCPSICLSVRPSTLSLCCDNSNTFQLRTFKPCVWVIYQIRGTPIVFRVIKSKVKVTGNFFVFCFFFSFLSWMLHCAAITGIPFCRELSNLIRMFVWVRFWSSSNMGLLGSVCQSVCLSVHTFFSFHCAAITGIFFSIELSNFVRMFLWTRSRSTSNIPRLGSVCPSIRLSTLSLCCDNWNTFKLCIWVIYQIRGIPIVFGVITSKIKVTGNFFVFFFSYILCFFFYIPFSNATLYQILFDPFQTWNMDNMSDMGNTYCFWGHFVKG